jgi:ketosteroid isomerase-like protein
MSTTERPNVALVRSIYDAFARRDIPTVFALFDENVTIDQSTEVPWGGSFRGAEQAMQFFAGLIQHITSQVSLERFIDAGDRVVAIGRTKGTVNATGAAFDVPVAHTWHLRDGRVLSILFCIDNPTMRTAL